MPKPKTRPRTVWQEEDFEIKPSTIPGAGRGLFAKKLIFPDDTIGPYLGKVLSDRQAEREPYLGSLYLVWVCKDCWIDGATGGNYTRFINHHGKRPNAELIVTTRWKKARIGAKRKIRPGEEIFFDYGKDYWEALALDPEG
ncbi:MAG: SET domain-containing protein-lysine N-methyltransferase [Verrucomicrobiota bacterium]